MLLKELEGHVEKETSRLSEKQDAEKVELRAEVENYCLYQKKNIIITVEGWGREYFENNLTIKDNVIKQKENGPLQVRAMCEKLEGSVTEQLRRSSNELQTLDYR